MAKGRWNHTASITMMLANVNRDPKKQAMPFEAFNPYAEKRGRGGTPLDKQSLHMFKSRFKKKGGDNGSS